jgi:Carboxypeptidase regulatory-like domain/TonB-dependent Receptor Plug Domain
MTHRWFGWAAAFAALVPAALSAQILGGRVMDKATNEPLKDAVVEVLTPAGRSVQRQRTDRDGFFVFELKDAGEYRLRTSFPGYQPATTSAVAVEERQTVQVEVHISTTEVTLDPLTVTARSQPPHSTNLDRQGFYERERRGFGLFLTQYELSQRLAASATELFRGLPGVQVTPNGGNNHYSLSITRSGQNCPPKILLDGSPVNDDDLDGFVQPGDVDGIEIYRGPSEVPGQWMAYRSACGLIAIWTKRGEPNRSR